MFKRLKDFPDLRISSGIVVPAGLGGCFGIVPGAGVQDTEEDGAVPGDFHTLFKSEAHPVSIKTAVMKTAMKKHGLFFVRFILHRQNTLQLAAMSFIF
ncbi:MAG: hypothetical protein P8012_08205 [Desulfobacterales bacterium]